MHLSYLRSVSPAKKAVAFFRISRSSRSFLFSLRSWPSSARSSLFSPGLLAGVDVVLGNPVAKGLVGDAEVLGDLGYRVIAGLDQAHCFGSELVGVRGS